MGVLSSIALLLQGSEMGPMQNAAFAGVVMSTTLLLGGMLLTKAFSKPPPTIPGPPPHPIFLNTLDILRNMPRLVDWVMEMCALYGGKTGLGTWRILLRFAPSFVVVNDPENIKRILENIDIYAKGPMFRKM